MDLRQYQWTPEGRQRVAWAIQATLMFNQQNNLKPGKLRALAALAGLPNHTSLGKYHREATSHPNNEGGRILRAAAPFIYRIEAFHVTASTGSDRLVSVDFVSPPDPGNKDVAPWEQAETYDFDSLASLGTRAGEELEVVAGRVKDCPPEAIWLYEMLTKLAPDALNLMAKIAKVSPVTMETLVGRGDGAIALDHASFGDLSEVLKDFLVRVTPEKALIWDVEHLAAAKGIKPDVSGLTPERLRDIIFRGAKATPSELSRLAGCMAAYGVSWDIVELEILNSRQNTLSAAALSRGA